MILAAIELHMVGLQPDRAVPGIAKGAEADEDLLLSMGPGELRSRRSHG